MGFIRKSIILGTGGLARPVMNQNSKKQRTAIAAKKTAKQARKTAHASASAARAQRSVARESKRQTGFLRKTMMDSYTNEREEEEHGGTVLSNRADRGTVQQIAEDGNRLKKQSLDEHGQSGGFSQGFVADELTKLAKLKVDGVLTEEEFAAQKAKLLST
jgi:hypothetical protein